MSEEKAVDMFIGPRKITGMSNSQKKTPDGGAIFDIVYDGGHKESIPKKTYDILVATESKDWNELQKVKFKPIIQDILNVLTSYDLKATELDELLRSVGAEVDNSFNRAVSYLWTKDDSLFVPGFNPMMERTLLESLQIVEDIPAKEDKEDDKK